MLCHDIAHDHRQKRHENAVDEIDGLEIPHEAHAAGNACADEEDHEAKLPERFEHLLARHEIGAADVAEVAEHQRDEQRAARCGEREEVEELHRAKQNAKHGGDGEGREAEIVKFQKLALEFSDIACLYVCNFSALLVQIRVDDARHQLHEQHNADDAEQIRNAVADRDRVLILGCNSLFGCRERRSRGQTAREQAGDHSRKLVRVVARLPGFNRTADEQTQNCRNAAGKNDHDAEQHIGLEVVLHVLEEVRARDKAD